MIYSVNSHSQLDSECPMHQNALKFGTRVWHSSLELELGITFGTFELKVCLYWRIENVFWAEELDPRTALWSSEFLTKNFLVLLMERHPNTGRNLCIPIRANVWYWDSLFEMPNLWLFETRVKCIRCMPYELSVTLIEYYSMSNTQPTRCSMKSTGIYDSIAWHFGLTI